MENKKLTASFVLSVIIHVVFIVFLFSFSFSKLLPDTTAPVAVVSLISPPSAPQPVVPNPPKPLQKSPEKLPVQPKQEIPQISEQPIIPADSEPEEPAETSKDFRQNSEPGENFAESSTETSNTAVEPNQYTSDEAVLTNAPKALYMPKIPYPRAAKNAKIEGIAEISYTIDEKGRVSFVEILSVPHPSFENIIKRTVLSWRFSPATQNEKAVSMKAKQTIVFTLE